MAINLDNIDPDKRERLAKAIERRRNAIGSVVGHMWDVCWPTEDVALVNLRLAVKHLTMAIAHVRGVPYQDPDARKNPAAPPTTVVMFSSISSDARKSAD